MNMKIKDKIAGAVYGFAIGDAMGATTEFMSREQIKNIYGKVNDIVGGGWLNLKPGEVTDDTQMTLCVMDAIIKYNNEGDISPFRKQCGYNFMNWLDSNPKDIGSQCLKGIQHFIDGDIIQHDCNALGNGSLMRAMPCAIIGKYDLNVWQGRITHNNYLCDKLILAYSHILREFMYDSFNFSTFRKVLGIKEFVDPTGCVINTFTNSVLWASESQSFKEAIIGAVNDGGDADTIAAITGSLAGARFGIEHIPQEWVNKLDKNIKCKLDEFIEFAFSQVCKQNEKSKERE